MAGRDQAGSNVVTLMRARPRKTASPPRQLACGAIDPRKVNKAETGGLDLARREEGVSAENPVASRDLHVFCMRPPIRFRRSGWMGAPESRAVAPAGGC